MLLITSDWRIPCPRILSIRAFGLIYAETAQTVPEVNMARRACFITCQTLLDVIAPCHCPHLPTA